MRSPTWRGNNTDFYSGLLLVTVASVALLYIRTLAIGTVLQVRRRAAPRRAVAAAK